MKKVLILLASVILLSGCGLGMEKEEKSKLFYESLEKAFVAVYSSDGVGLAVLADEVKEIEGENWYKVAITKYDRLEKVVTLASEVYDSKIAKEINDKILTKYQDIDNELYTTSKGGCLLDYTYEDNLQERLKEDAKITSYGINTITFKYKGKEYKAKLTDDNRYVFKDKIFVCQIIGE